MTARRLLASLLLLVLLSLAAGWIWLLHTQSGARWIWAQVASATNNALGASEISGDLGSGLVGKGIAYESDGIGVSIGEVSFAVDIDLLPVRVTVLPARVTDLRIDLRGDRHREPESDIRRTFAALRLPVELEFTDVELERGAISGIGEDRSRSITIDTFSLAGRWKDRWIVERFTVKSVLGDAEGNGHFNLDGDNEVLLATTLQLPAERTGLADTVSVDTTVQGPLEGLVLQARMDEPRVHLRGRVSNVTSAIRWEARLNAPSLDLPAHIEVPEFPPVEISVEASGDTQSAVVQALLGFANNDMRIAIMADVDLGAATLSSKLDWQHAHWPIGHPQPRVSSRSGQVAVSGTLDDWTVAGTIELAVPEFPPGTLTIDGGGDLDRAVVQILDGAVLGGNIAGRAEYSWRGHRPFAAGLELREIRTAAVLPEWPAVLSGTLDLQGQQHPLRISIQLSDVAGAYGDRTLRADGGIDIIDGKISVHDLRVRHGETRVRVTGSPYAVDGLSYELHVDDLGHYLEDSFGSISANGVLSLVPDSQFLRVDASSDEFGWRDLRVAELGISDRGDGILDAIVTARSVQIGATDIGRLSLRANMGKDRQSLEMETMSDAIRSALSVSGALDSFESPSSWSGQLTRLEFDHDALSASLGEPAAIALTRQSASIVNVCAAGGSGFELCADLAWDSNSGLDLAATLASLPANLINAFFDTGTELSQVVSGAISLKAGAAGITTGRGDIDITPGRIASTVIQDLYVDTGPTSLGFDIRDGSLKAGLLDIPIPGLGHIRSQFEIPDVGGEDPATIDGSIDVEIEDIALLIALFPVFDHAEGVLRADLDIGGTVTDPMLSGVIVLEKASLTYLPIGLQLDDIELRSELQQDGEIELAGSFRAGDGRAEIRTRADHATTAATGLEITLRGDNLTVIDVPDIRAVADTDLRIDFDGDNLDLNGSISIPYARIRPANIGTTRVDESEDVVIIAGELPDEAVDDTPDSDINFTGTVVVALGNDVVVDLEVSQVNVFGNTRFNWSGGPVPDAIGRYDVDGEVLVFGQRLEITEGSVRFDDVPADNPYLRVRAEREIYGNTQVRRAGVLVAGSLTRPTIEAYTNPVTTEERAVTLLVTGSDFDYERGVGGIGFGTYIAPRVYASYGIGLFDNENVIRIRYDLRQGFGITGTSGRRESGVDLSYRFEN